MSEVQQSRLDMWCTGNVLQAFVTILSTCVLCRGQICRPYYYGNLGCARVCFIEYNKY